jgi:hypothetical protein
LVVVLEPLQFCELEQLDDVQPGSVADFVLDAPRGLVEDRRLVRRRIVVAPGGGLLPHRRDVLGAGGLPPGLVEHGPQAGGG